MSPPRRPRPHAVHVTVEGGPFRDVPATAVRRRAERMLGSLAMGSLDLSVALVGDGAMRALHERWMGGRKTTDVLAFPLHDDPLRADADHRARGASLSLGDVVISIPQARRQAAGARRGVLDEVTTLLGHGILHLLGFDHRTKDEQREMDAYTRVLEAAASSRTPSRAWFMPKRGT